MLRGAMDWLRRFFPGYFALVMGTGTIAVAAHLLVWVLTFIGMCVQWLHPHYSVNSTGASR